MSDPTELQRQERQRIQHTGIGASEAAAACGYDEWRPALQVYYEKVGLIESQADSGILAWGRFAENGLARFYNWKTGRKIRKVREVVRHPKHPFLFCSPDFESEEINIQCKTSDYAGNWGAAGTSEVPITVLIQVTVEMSCTGKRLTHIPAKVGYGAPRIYEVPFDPALEAEIIAGAHDFWQHVERQDPPAIDWDNPATPKFILDFYSDKLVADRRVELYGPEALKLARTYEQLTMIHNESEKRKQYVRAQLEAMMDGAGIAYLSDGSYIVRTVVQRKGFTVEPTEYVKFAIKAPKSSKEKKIASGRQKQIESGNVIAINREGPSDDAA